MKAPDPPDTSRKRGTDPRSPSLGVIPRGTQHIAAATLRLVCGSGPCAGMVFALTKDRNTIGRADPAANMVVDIDLSPCEVGETRPSISRQHAEIVRTVDGWLIVDLGSANRTTADGRPLQPGQPEELRPGVRLTLGRLIFAVESG